MTKWEQWAVLALLGSALVLVVVRARRAGALVTWVDRTAVIVALVLALVAFAGGGFRLLARRSERRADRLADWSACSTAMRGVPWRQQRAIVRALRCGEPVPEPLLEPARQYAGLRSTDTPVWTITAVALVQAGGGGGRYDSIPFGIRVGFVFLAASAAVLLMRHAARWRHILEALPERSMP